MSCPFCGSTDTADLVTGGRICLDCENAWNSRTDKAIARAYATRDWYDRLPHDAA